jgi:hypothetical protein
MLILINLMYIIYIHLVGRTKSYDVDGHINWNSSGISEYGPLP